MELNNEIYIKMKEILEEVVSKIENPLDPSVYYNYVEYGKREIFRVEHFFCILEYAKSTGRITRRVFVQSFMAPEEQILMQSPTIDLLEIHRKRLLQYVIQYGIMSALASYDKTPNSK